MQPGREPELKLNKKKKKRRTVEARLTFKEEDLRL
jgi:hypothetical protein